jgi:lipopolysaccharide export LptBFGC system permease protein LptF
LRPLTDKGVDAEQLRKILLYLMPAMLTYALPIAAVFAATMTYGRLAADNELTACRAAGISHGAMATPVLVMGLILSIATLLFLSFVVPAFFLKVERVTYSNLGRIVARQIQNTHHVLYGPWNVFAQDAAVDEAGSSKNNQVVVLQGPMITQFEKRGPDGLLVPREFWMAQRASVYIHQYRKTDQVKIEAVLSNGVRFPARFKGGVQGDVQVTQIGPIEVPSPVKENTKFMDIWQLKELYQDVRKSKKINGILQEYIRDEQELALLRKLKAQLDGEAHEATLHGADNPQERYVITPGEAPPQLHNDELILSSGGTSNKVTVTQYTAGGAVIPSRADQIQIKAQADNDNGRMIVSMRLDGGTTRRLNVSMSEEIRQLQNRDVKHYMKGSGQPAARLRKEVIKLQNGIEAERHGRASFAVSCLILVVVGCALGMMFRSGNFLTAFAISVIPAMVTITLIIMGQQTCQNATVKDQLRTGLMLIWSGNAAVAVLATALMWRLHKQ